MSRSKGARSGIFFGAASGVITTIGLIAGLHAGTSSTSTVLKGILVIAIADSMSDALGMHLAEESKPGASHKQVWAATISTFITKLLFAVSFAIPILLLPLNAAVIASITWGMIVIILLSIYIARARGDSPLPIVAEHVGIAILVVILSHLVGDWVSKAFAGDGMTEITWDDFQKVELRAGTVLSVDEFPEARQPAYKLRIDFGDEIGVRKSSAQITDRYSMDELVGRQVLAVINFPAKQIGPFMSECLVTGFVAENGEVVLAVPDRAVDNGVRLA